MRYADTEELLRTYDTIVVVGASVHPEKAAHAIPAVMQRYGWRIIPVNPHADEIFGERVYRRLVDIPDGPIGLVNVFRPSRDAADIARQAVAAGAPGLVVATGDRLSRSAPNCRRGRRRLRRRSLPRGRTGPLRIAGVPPHDPKVED